MKVKIYVILLREHSKSHGMGSAVVVVLDPARSRSAVVPVEV